MELIMKIQVDTFTSWKEKEKAISIAKADKRLTPFQFVMLDTFARCHEAKYRPTIITLMSQFGKSNRHIINTIQKLCDYGYIEKKRLSDTNNYDIVLYIHIRPMTIKKHGEL